MKRDEDPVWLPLALGGSVLLLAASLCWWLVRWPALRDSPGSGDAGYAILGEGIMLILYCSAGVILSWLLAGAAALKGKKPAVWLLVVETPFLFYALYWMTLVLSF